MLEKLSKLKNKSISEIGDRFRQTASTFIERNVPAWYNGEETREIPGFSDDIERFLSINQSVFFASMDDIDVTKSKLETSFASEIPKILEKADDICRGYFNFLGYERLNFGQGVPDFHLDAVSGKTFEKMHWSRIGLNDDEATGDKKVVWELNRHQYFSTLGQAYLLSGDEKYADTFAAHLHGWFDQNPHKIGVNWLSSLEIAFRSISWIGAIRFFKNSPHLTPELFGRTVKYLYLQARHIETYLSTHFSPNTHLTGEALGLYFIGSFLSEANKLHKWKEKGYDIMMDALDFQIGADGVYCEQSSHYSRYTADFYATLMILRRREGLPIETRHLEKLESLYEFLMHIAPRNGETPFFGDEDGGRLYFFDDRPVGDFRPSLALGAVLFNRADFKFAAGDATPELLWLTGAGGLGDYRTMETKEPEESDRAFTSGGFFVTRSSWREDANYLLIDCGPHGFLNGGHAHADALGFVLSFDGVPVFVDSGTYLYAVNKAERERFRSSFAHNCLVVNGESSSIPAGPFSWKTQANARLLDWTVSEDGAFFRGTHDGFGRFGVEYVREIRFQNGEIEIADIIDCAEANSYELHFILDPAIECYIDGGSARFERSDRLDWGMTMKTEVSAEVAVEFDATVEAWEISPVYGKLVATKKIVQRFKAAGGLTIRNRISRTENPQNEGDSAS